MPEGPEILCSVNILKKQLEGFYITKVTFEQGFDKRNLLDRKLLLNDIPLKIVEIVARAKRVNFICDNNRNEGGVLIWFYALQGRLCFKPKTSHHVEMTISKKTEDNFEEVTKLYYEDVINLGFMKYAVTTNQIEDIYKHIGPDFTNDEVTAEMFETVIKNKRIKHKFVVDFLLDQKYFSGIGNYLRAEILYDAKIRPSASLMELVENDKITILYNSIRSVMRCAISSGGMTSRNYTDPNGDIGRFQAKVYNKKTDDFGNIIISDKLGKIPKGKDTRRTIWWCPNLQN